jgi:hypothetical protein
VAIVRIEELNDGLVIHFQTTDQRINAYTLATTLMHFADAVRAANRSINPGQDLEVVVEALASGSFRAKINAIYRSAGNLFSAQSIQTIVLSIVANFVYEKIHPPAEPVKIIVQADEVIIDRGNDQIIVPRNVYVATQEVAKDPRFTTAIAQAVSAVAADSRITGLTFVPTLQAPTPEFIIPRETLQAYLPTTQEPEPIERTIIENCDLQIVKAILERSDRKWEFRWRGVKVSAPVSDQSFYSRFFAHRITIAPGDELRVRMAIRQVRQPESRIYTNTSYEVIEVTGHTSKVQQLEMSEPASSSTNE